MAVSTTRIQPCHDAYIGLQYGNFGCNTDKLHLCMVFDKWLHLEQCNRFLHPFECGVAIWCFCNAHKKLMQPWYGCKHGYCDQQNGCVSYCCNKTRGCNMIVLPQTNLSQNRFIATPLLRGNMAILSCSVLHCINEILQHNNLVASHNCHAHCLQ